MSDEDLEETVEETTDETVEEVEETIDEKGKKTKKKRVIRRRASKKDKEDPVHSAIRLTVESGKVGYGYRDAIRNCSSKKTKLLILANNVLLEVSSKLKNSNTSEIPFFTYEGSSLELGSICGKPYPVSVISVFDFGSSNISKFVKKK